VKPNGTGGQEVDGSEPAGSAPDAGSPLRAPAMARSESVVVRTAASRVVPVGTTNSEPDLTLRAPVVRPPVTDDAVTTVDHAFEPLTLEQREALALRVRSELEQTRRMGTPTPAAVQSGHSIPAHPFKRTMTIGVARSPSSAPPPPPASVKPGAESEPPSLRASFVRVVGPPKAPPPRRPRRTGSSAPEETPREAASRIPESEPEHEAFQLDRRSSPGIVVAAASPPTARAPGTGTSVMLPPPPQPGDYESSSPSSFPPAVVRSELQQSGTLRLPERRSEPLGVPRQVERQSVPLADLPSVDPFAGFVTRPPSFLERWLVVLVVALALVGAAALAAIALGYLGRPGP
jgi:hypothetical protein